MKKEEFDKQWEEAKDGERTVRDVMDDVDERIAGAEDVSTVQEIMQELTRNNHKEDDEQFINEGSFFVIEGHNGMD